MVIFLQLKNILLKHLETAPKEILGNFPRLSRDNALAMMNGQEKLQTSQDSDTTSSSNPPCDNQMDDKDADSN